MNLDDYLKPPCIGYRLDVTPVRYGDLNWPPDESIQRGLAKVSWFFFLRGETLNFPTNLVILP